MSLRRKILISNIIMVCVPVVLAVSLCIAYVKLGKNSYLNPLNDDGGTLSMSQSVLYYYEAELSDMDWEALAKQPDADPDVVPSAQARRISELSDMGYHFQVKLSDRVLFQNFDVVDESAFALTESLDFDEGFLRSGDCIIIWDSLAREEGIYLVAAVYNEARADNGVRRSVLPVYMVSPAALIVLVLIVLLGIVITNFLLTRWLDHSILRPLDLLKSGAEEIGRGNLDHRMEYDRQDEFGAVCREFDAMREELKRAEAVRVQYEMARRDLLNGVSHDLRSPLTSIRGYAEGLRDGVADTDEKRNRYYDAILTRAADLERLTDSLSSLTHLENGAVRLRIEAVVLDEYLRLFISEQTPYLKQNHVDIEYKNDASAISVYLDRQEMRRVLLNLLENSVKHRVADASQIHIFVKDAGHGNTAEIYLADDGPGVPPEQLDRIFESFYRGDDARTKPENGSGLGLAIVKNIIDAHGGEVSAYLEGGLGILIQLPVVEE